MHGISMLIMASLPDLGQADPEHDLVFTWNGTTSGVRVPDGDWIADEREGLTLCDATSAVFAQDLPWYKAGCHHLQLAKGAGWGGRARHADPQPAGGRAAGAYSPPWPLPKIFRLTKDGTLIEGIFEGATINTPSMLCVADYLDALAWVRDMVAYRRPSAAATATWRCWKHSSTNSRGSDFWPKTLRPVPIPVCACRWICRLTALKQMVALLAQEQVAFDIGAYRDAPRVCASGVAPRWRQVTWSF